MSIVTFGIRPAKYASNPIININGSAWYAEQIMDPQVMVDPSDSSKLIMYTTGFAAPVATGEMSIGRFTSTVANPRSWVETGQVLTKGAGGTWDSAWVRLGCIFKDGSTYYLFYSGFDNATLQIGLATSSDGLTFTKSPSNPILTPTGQSRNDGAAVEDPAVIKEGSAWTMIYSYRTLSTILPGFRCATSSDGTSWTKVGSSDVLTTNPLYGEWHTLSNINGLYHLVYEAGSTTVPYQCFLATSGVVTGPYVNSPYNPMLSYAGTVGAWDRYHVATPQLVEINGIWRVFYSGAGDHDQPYTTNTWPMGMADYAARPLAFGGRQAN